MVKTIISVDLSKKPTSQPLPIHNRWHPDIPAVARVEPGETVRIECLDWTGGQIHNDDNAKDIKYVDLTQVHYLSGPIAVTGTQPGDLLVVDIIDLGPLPGHEWGYTAIFAKENGGGFLTDHFPHAAKAVWDLEDVYATSRHMPGVRFAGIAHPGLIGVAPSKEMLQRWNTREAALFNSNAQRIPPLASLPDAKNAAVGSLTGPQAEFAMREGARTVPARENGGNADINALTRGSRVYFPVFIKDAHLSVGDLHFSQGDGEISFCGAIEMAGWITLKIDVIKDGAKKYKIHHPLHKPAEPTPRYQHYLSFQGISVDAHDKQYYLDATLSYQNACLSAINYLTQFGYTAEQAYILLSAAPIQAHIRGIVDIPNACITLSLPTEIFNFNILPDTAGPITHPVNKELRFK